MLILHSTTPENNMSTHFIVTQGEEIPLGYPHAGLYLKMTSVDSSARCPHCGFITSSVHQRHIKPRVRGGSFNETPIYLEYPHVRFICHSCNVTFMERTEDLQPHAQMTTNAKRAILHAVSTRTFKDIARSYGVTSPTVSRILHEELPSVKRETLQSTYHYLGMDELYISRNSQNKASYYWVLNDLSDRRKVDTIRIDEGRLQQDVIQRLQALQHSEKIRAIAIDMWEPYKDAILTALPHVDPVIDPFHVVQLGKKALNDVRIKYMRSLTKEERQKLKSSYTCLNRSLYSLTESEMDSLNELFEKVPALETAYFLNLSLRAIYREKDYEAAFNRLAQWETMVLESGFTPFISHLQTIQRWLPWIMNFFIHRITNGKTEGRNNLIRMIDRQGFHYKSKSLEGRVLFHDRRKNQEKWLIRQKGLESCVH